MGIDKLFGSLKKRFAGDEVSEETEALFSELSAFEELFSREFEGRDDILLKAIRFYNRIVGGVVFVREGQICGVYAGGKLLANDFRLPRRILLVSSEMTVRRAEGEGALVEIGPDEVVATGELSEDYIEAEYRTVMPVVDFEAVVTMGVAQMKTIKLFAPFAAYARLPEGIYVDVFVFSPEDCWAVVVRRVGDEFEQYVHSGALREVLNTVVNILGNFALTAEDTLRLCACVEPEVVVQQTSELEVYQPEARQTVAEVFVEFYKTIESRFGVETRGFWNCPAFECVRWDPSVVYWHETIERLNYIKRAKMVMIVGTVAFVLAAGNYAQKVNIVRKELATYEAKARVYQETLKKINVKFRSSIGYMVRAYILGRQPDFDFVRELPVEDGVCVAFRNYTLNCDAGRRGAWVCSIRITYDNQGCAPLEAVSEVKNRWVARFRQVKMVSLVYHPASTGTGRGTVTVTAKYELK